MKNHACVLLFYYVMDFVVIQRHYKNPRILFYCYVSFNF